MLPYCIQAAAQLVSQLLVGPECEFKSISLVYGKETRPTDSHDHETKTNCITAYYYLSYWIQTNSFVPLCNTQHSLIVTNGNVWRRLIIHRILIPVDCFIKMTETIAKTIQSINKLFSQLVICTIICKNCIRFHWALTCFFD